MNDPNLSFVEVFLAMFVVTVLTLVRVICNVSRLKLLNPAESHTLLSTCYRPPQSIYFDKIDAENLELYLLSHLRVSVGKNQAKSEISGKNVKKLVVHIELFIDMWFISQRYFCFGGKRRFQISRPDVRKLGLKMGSFEENACLK